jgi:hypothetical protein
MRLPLLVHLALMLGTRRGSVGIRTAAPLAKSLWADLDFTWELQTNTPMCAHGECASWA